MFDVLISSIVALYSVDEESCVHLFILGCDGLIPMIVLISNTDGRYNIGTTLLHILLLV